MKALQTHGKALFLIITLGIGGGFQNGYHSSGLNSPSPYIQRFINSSWYDRYEESPPPQTVTMIWSLIVSLYPFGGLLGSLGVKTVADMLGRKKAMICNNFINIVAAGIMLASKGAKSYEMIIMARILQGCFSGLGISLHAMYLGEISPTKLRGAVLMTCSIFTALGKVSGQFFGLSEILGREELWHILLCVPALFSAVHIIVLPFLPEAPRYLFIEKGDDKACKKALQSLWGEGDYKEQMDEMLAEQAAIEAAPPKRPLQLLKDRSVRWQLMAMTVICFSNYLSGITVITVFSFDICLKFGLLEDMIRYVNLGLGIFEIMIFIFCGLLIERTGRRPLFWGGYGLMFVCWVFVTVTLNLKNALNSYCFVLFAVVCLLGCLYSFFFVPETKGKTPLEISEEFKAITVGGKSFFKGEIMETKL
ncbi:solute carrier family 2, facilitated glucose transporter member 9-like [Symphorus nematophorus]